MMMETGQTGADEFRPSRALQDGQTGFQGKRKPLENAVFSRGCGNRSRTRTCDPIGLMDVLCHTLGCTFTITESPKRSAQCFSADRLMILLDYGSFLPEESKG